MVNFRKTRHEICCSVFRDWWNKGPTGKLTVKILVLSTRTVGPKISKTSLGSSFVMNSNISKPPSRCISSRFQIPIITNLILGWHHLIHGSQISESRRFNLKPLSHHSPGLLPQKGCPPRGSWRPIREMWTCLRIQNHVLMILNLLMILLIPWNSVMFLGQKFQILDPRRLLVG